MYEMHAFSRDGSRRKVGTYRTKEAAESARQYMLSVIGDRELRAGSTWEYALHPDYVSRRRSVRVTFSDGRTIATDINGTKDEIRAYYVEQALNFGDTPLHPADDLQIGVEVEFVS